MTFIGSCLFVSSIYLSAESRVWYLTRGPWVTRRPSNQGSKKGQPSLWLRRKNLGQGLPFCNFLPGKLPHTGTFYISSARPPIVVSFCFCLEFFWRNQSGDHLPTSHVGSSRPLKPQLSLGRGPGPMQATAYIGLFANGNDPFPIKIGLQLVWRGVHSGRNHRFGIKDPLFPTEMH